MIEIKIPEDKELAAAIGEALVKWSGKAPVVEAPAPAVVEEEPVGKEEALKHIEKMREMLEADEPPASLFEDQPEPEPEVVTEPAVEVDAKGVRFNPLWCDPAGFVKRGDRKGCWKAAKGASPAGFKDWYQSQITPKAPEDETEEDKARKAFASPNNPEPLLPPTDAPQEPPAEDVPTTCPELLAWISEKKASGFIDDSGVKEAYGVTGLTPRDLFPPRNPAEIAAGTLAIYNHLKGIMKSV